MIRRPPRTTPTDTPFPYTPLFPSPKGTVNPDAIALLERSGYPIEGLHSKRWEAFSEPDSPVMDFVFTVCDDAAGEVCPIWPGHPMTAHWGIEDPSHVEEIGRAHV